jgi:hypothetical protein
MTPIDRGIGYVLTLHLSQRLCKGHNCKKNPKGLNWKKVGRSRGPHVIFILVIS